MSVQLLRSFWYALAEADHLVEHLIAKCLQTTKEEGAAKTRIRSHQFREPVKQSFCTLARMLVLQFAHDAVDHPSCCFLLQYIHHQRLSIRLRAHIIAHKNRV